MFPRPCLLHKLIIDVNVVCLDSEFTQVAGVKVHRTEEAFISRPDLVVIRFVFKVRMVRIERG